MAAAFSGPDAPSSEDLYRCVHCGFCLEACPTYVETGLETESPRGRIALMRAVAEGRTPITPTVLSHWDRCIQCRACEPACPSGVRYGRLIEATMAQVWPRAKPSMPVGVAAAVALRHVLPHQGRLALAARVLRLYQRLGIRRLVRATGVLRLASPRLHGLEAVLPPIPSRFFSARGQVLPAVGERRARVGLLAGCVMAIAHGPQVEAATRVLTRNGCEVVVPSGQACCGAISAHVGDRATARALARRNVDAFLGAGVDAVVVPAAGCSMRVREYGHLLASDPAFAERARTVAAMTRDIQQFLALLPLDPPRARLDLRVAFQDSCHLSHAQGVTEQPRALLRAIPGVELVEIEDAARCCGSGGTFMLAQRELSLRLGDKKMSAVARTGASVVATANPGCVLQLQGAAARAGLPVQVCYVTDLLDQAYQAERAD